MTDGAVVRSKGWRFLSRVGTLAALLLLPSCVSFPIPERMSQGAGGSLGWKPLAQKRPPNLLISVSRDTCEVPRSRFERVQIGDLVFCYWRSRRGGLGRPLPPENLDELHVEDEHPGRRPRPGGGIAVGQLRRNPETTLFPFAHELESLNPSLDDATDGEL